MRGGEQSGVSLVCMPSETQEGLVAQRQRDGCAEGEESPEAVTEQGAGLKFQRGDGEFSGQRVCW